MNHRCLTVAEVISFGIYTNVLSQYSINAVWSRRSMQNKIVSLCLDASGPVLKWIDANEVNNQSITPSRLYIQPAFVN